MANEVISRANARMQGLSRYFTGAPCCRTHVAERYVSNGHCVECERENAEKRLDAGEKRDAWLARRREARSSAGGRAKEREWVANNRERVRDAAKRSYYNNLEKNRARAKRWREENPDKRQAYIDAVGREKGKEYREKNREAFKAYYRQWQIDNPDKVAAADQKRRARKNSSPGTHTAEDLAAILKAQKHRCAYCRADLKRAKRHVDHIIPLALGGSNDRTNIQALCPPCNLKKGARDPLDYARSIGLLL